MNKRLNKICSLHKVIKPHQKCFTRPLNLYGLVLGFPYELFEVTKW